MSEDNNNAPQDSAPQQPEQPQQEPKRVPADSSPFRMPEGSGVKGGDFRPRPNVDTGRGGRRR